MNKEKLKQKFYLKEQRFPPSQRIDDCFFTCKNYLLSIQPFDFLNKIKIKYNCPYAIKDNKNSPRVFAHTLHEPDRICVFEDLGKLYKKYLYGIMLHEFGHIIADHYFIDHSEDLANSIMKDFFHLTIKYSQDIFKIEFLNKRDEIKINKFKKGK